MFFIELIADRNEFITYISKIVRFSKCIFYLLGKDDLNYEIK